MTAEELWQQCSFSCVKCRCITPGIWRCGTTVTIEERRYPVCDVCIRIMECKGLKGLAIEVPA